VEEISLSLAALLEEGNVLSPPRYLLLQRFPEVLYGRVNVSECHLLHG
jgi:hypothetical protein